MKRILLFIYILSFIFASSTFAFSKEVDKPVLLQEGKHKQWCPVCGMSLKKFYMTSHALKHKDSTKQYCSMRCLAVDMKQNKINAGEMLVVDVVSQKFIDVKNADYVVGSDVRGTMSRVSKLAFLNAESAEDFSMEHGGDIVGFDKAFAMAKESLGSDIAMVMKKKEKKMYPMGKKIFEKSCNKNIDLKEFEQINQLKAAIKDDNLCKVMKEQQLQALSLYLWEVKRLEGVKSVDETIKITNDEKCPVCGMFVYKYPKWAAQIFYNDAHYSFDGVKDMMKYYHKHRDGVLKIIVTDYYSQKAIDAFGAYFVVGSDVYGPMGDELIPFSSQSEAKTFSMDHKGFKLLRFDDITEKEVYKLDE